jgi:hypothetical protein
MPTVRTCQDENLTKIALDQSWLDFEPILRISAGDQGVSGQDFWDEITLVSAVNPSFSLSQPRGPQHPVAVFIDGKALCSCRCFGMGYGLSVTGFLSPGFYRVSDFP